MTWNFSVFQLKRYAASAALGTLLVTGALHCAADAAPALQAQSVCGWIGVRVSPMTPDIAESLGMPEPYGAIFDKPDPDSPAAGKIEQGDVLTAINGSTLTRAGDFAGIISSMAPGTTVYLNTWRNTQANQVKLVLRSGPCPAHSPG